MDEKGLMVWAFEHPYLYTLIEIKVPVLLALVLFSLGAKLILAMTQGKSKRRV